MLNQAKVILISSEGLETRVAILEGNLLAEYYIEDTGKPRLRGNIYLGAVRDILPGMEAAFVDIGLERNAFLYVEDIPGFRRGADKSTSSKINELLKEGQNVVVQVVRPPAGGKGARVTGHITLPGRKLVLSPTSRAAGVSRKLEDNERERLTGICRELKPPGMGIIARTAAEGATREEIVADLEYLMKLWRLVSERAEKGHPPACVYGELGLASSIVRDVFSPDYVKLIVDEAETFEEVTHLVRNTSPGLLSRIELHKDHSLPLFEKYNIPRQVTAALNRKVWLRSGGYIAIDRTEALTAIDVNTGKYTGGKNLEQTVYKTNLEAAAEIVRQLRLRDIGGIIVIDFIDMLNQDKRDAVFECLNSALKQDRTKSRVVGISRIGLVEMTRKNVSMGLSTHYFDTCPTCGGLGKVGSRHRDSVDVAHKIVTLARRQAGVHLLFGVSAEVMAELSESDGHLLKRLSRQSGKQVRLYAVPELSGDELMLAAEGTEEDVERYLERLRY